MKINKAQLDRLIEAERNLFCFEDITAEEKDKRIQESVGANFELKCKARHIDSLVFAIVARQTGIKPDATNEDIYKVLEVLGCEVEQ